jgi:LEA14-like dessication related protein
VLITSLTPLESTLLEQRVRVGLRFQNPNDFELAMSGLQVSVDVNDARLLRAVDGSALTIPRLGEADLTVEASTTMLELVLGLLRARDDRFLRYRVAGACTSSSPRRGSSRS